MESSIQSWLSSELVLSKTDLEPPTPILLKRSKNLNVFSKIRH